MTFQSWLAEEAAREDCGRGSLRRVWLWKGRRCRMIRKGARKAEVEVEGQDRVTVPLSELTLLRPKSEEALRCTS